jgi:hypothetical protein
MPGLLVAQCLGLLLFMCLQGGYVLTGHRRQFLYQLAVTFGCQGNLPKTLGQLATCWLVVKPGQTLLFAMGVATACHPALMFLFVRICSNVRLSVRLSLFPCASTM